MSGPRIGQSLLVAAAVVIAATVIAAIVVMGPPGVQRERRLDEARVLQLMQIETGLRTLYTRSGRLPADLSAVADEPGFGLSLADPQTGVPYGYRPLGRDAFELCAVFARDSAKDSRDMGPGAYGDLQWRHPAGRHCFVVRLKPARP